MTLDDELRREGLARELVRALNDLRKRLDLQLSDRVRIRVDADGEVAAALSVHGDAVAGEVLAVVVELGAVDDGERIEVAGHPLDVRLDVVDAPS